MQNKFKKILSFVKDKGYYILLILCTLAVGMTGYFLVTNRDPDPTVEPDIPTQVSTAPTTTGKQPIADVIATQPTAPATEAQPFRLRKPVDGTAFFSFAADRLAYNETTRDWRTHEGVDLAAEVGTEVLAAAEGHVARIYEDEQFGMTVVLSHGNGYLTSYSNLNEEIPVSVGDYVSAGAVLGVVGNTAGAETASQPHIHFALYQNDRPLNPEDFWD